MRFRNGWLLKTVAIGAIAWMAGNAAVAQSDAPNFGGGSTIKVNCNKKGSIGATLAHLSHTGNTRGVTIPVSGTCKENIGITGFDHLVMAGSLGASVQDAMNGSGIVFDVADSRADLPDAPSYTIPQPSIDASTAQPKRSLGAMNKSLAVGSGTTPLSAISKQFLNVAAPNSAGYSSLIFVGRTSSGTEVNGQHEQLDGSKGGSGTNCRQASADNNDGSGWLTSLLSITSKGERYCALGAGGFWKRGTYAATRAFVAHKYDGANSVNVSSAFGLGIAPGVSTSYYPYQNYSGERLAARYASVVGRDALRNMFREFWPDISTHMLHRHP